MRIKPRTALVGLALALLALLVVFLGSRGRRRPTDAAVVAPSAPELSRPAEPTDVAPVARVAPSSRNLAPTRQASAPEAARSERSLCIVSGRVVDEEGLRLPDVRVRLQAYKVWAEGVEVARLPGLYDMRGFEVRTDATGAFRIEAPPPTAQRTSLEITPDRFHDSHLIYFGVDRQRYQLPLAAGARDLGEIRLATTGALRGRVTDEIGRPLADVEMSIGPGRSTTYGRDARTESDGTFLIAHAPIGAYAVKARIEGYLSGYLEPVTVEGRRDTIGIDFALAPAPSIEGVVVDGQGQPIEGVRLHGWPLTSGSGAGAKSGADGRFVVHLPQDEPYTLGARRDGYLSWGQEHDRSITFAPGTRALEVVMEALPLTRFVVIDADSGQPVTRFGLTILEDNGSQASGFISTERRPPRQDDRPEGFAEATARPGIDLFLIAAEGYLLAQGDVAHDEAGVPIQTVRMQRGATVRGRVLRDGSPVAEAGVDIGQGRNNTSIATRTDADGRFELTAVPPAPHRLTVRPGEGAPLVAPVPRVSPGEVHDLGDLTLLPGGAVDGVVLLPPGVQPAGLEVWLDDGREGVKAIVDGSGGFRFEDLATGDHSLTLDDRPGLLAQSEPLPIELRSGQRLQVTLDARDRAMCAVTLTIELGDLAVAGRQVDLIAVGDAPERQVLGNCDASGVVTGHVRAWGEAKVVVHLSGMGSLVHPDVRLELRPMEELERRVRFELAALALVLPDSVPLPEQGWIRIQLAPTTPGPGGQSTHLSFVDGSPSGAAAEFAHTEPGLLRVGGLQPGSAELTVEFVDETSKPTQVDLGGGRMRIGLQPYYTSTRTVVLAAGAELSLRLE